MDDIFEKLTKKKEELDKYRPLAPELVQNLEEWLDVELTYTSNAMDRWKWQDFTAFNGLDTFATWILASHY